MRLVTRQEMANNAVSHFAKQYESHHRDGGTLQFRVGSGDSRSTLVALLALGPAPSPDAVEAVCEGWSRVTCDECGSRECEAVVEFCETERVVRLCEVCLLRGASLIKMIARSAPS